MTDDRRAPNAARIPFDAMVEVGGALGPSFEARAVNLSEDGMSLRTTYLPDIGQPITCRFEAGHGGCVVAAGEVLWREDMGDGGEFGVRFTNLDAASVAALHRILGTTDDAGGAQVPLGKKVRLHIEGLGSPMRARVRGGDAESVTAYSELGFLQVGKAVELEDALSGDKRPASIHRVAVEVEDGSRIPQLIVTLRYEDLAAEVIAPPASAEVAGFGHGRTHAPETAAAAPAEGDEDVPVDDDRAPPVEAHGEHAAMAASAAGKVVAKPDEDAEALKGAFARSAARVTPALERWAKQAKSTVSAFASRARAARQRPEETEMPVRRTTAPPPGGALHASGRRVVRGEIGEERRSVDELILPKTGVKITKKKLVVTGAVSGAALLAFFALHRSPATPPVASAPPAEAATLAHAAAASPAAPVATTPTSNDPLASAAPSMSDPDPKHHGKPQPFGNGPVGSHGNVLKLKMDGAIDRIQGASQPAGFTIVIPGRKSLDSAAPLAQKDPRIAAIRVSNEATGAELTVTFKDGVPNYQVRAKGDVLEMVIAKSPATADKDAPGGHKRHAKH